MTPVPALGITFVPSLAPERLRGLATDAEQAGLDEVALNWPPSVPPPLMLGGAGPQVARVDG